MIVNPGGGGNMGRGARRMTSCRLMLMSILALGWLAGAGQRVGAKYLAEPFSGPPPDMADAIGAWVDHAHAEISRHILGTADQFDSFFGDARIDEERQTTQLALGFSAAFRPDERTAFAVPVGLKLALPRLEDRLQLVMDALLRDDADAQDDDARNLRISLRYKVLEQVGRWIGMDGGVDMNFETIGWKTLQPFGLLRFRAAADFTSVAARLTQLVAWYGQSGWRGMSQGEVEWDLGRNTLARISGATEYAEAFEGQRYAATLLLRQQRSHNRAIGLRLRSEGRTHPFVRITAHEAQLTYRRRIYKEWAFLSIQPAARFERDDNFALTPLLRFELTCYFGRVAP